MQLVKGVYILVKSYPKEELYALAFQTKRAVMSVPCNIAEGIGRNYKKDTIQILHIARGPFYELETLLNMAVMLDVIAEKKFVEISVQSDVCMKILNGVISYFKKEKLK